MILPDLRAPWPWVLRSAAIALFLTAVPLLLGMTLMHLWHFDLSLPLKFNNSDAIWQFVLSKMLFDTGWVLDNPYLGAPDVAHWHGNASAQTSALHSVLMLGIAPFVPDAIKMQQVYFLLNFPLIAATSYLAGRLVGVGRWSSCCIGVLYAFTSWRLSSYIYAFLANHFIIPLSVVPPIWILSGRLPCSWRAAVRSWKVWLSLGITVLAASTDGYYAFFTLLLLGFAGGLRALTREGGLRSLVTPALLASALIVTAYGLAWPLRSYERAHQAEFVIDGKVDPALIKHPFEAEVYSTSLKLIMAPIGGHRIPLLRRLGAWMVDTSDRARAFPSGDSVQMGALASLLLIGALALVMVRASYTRSWPFSSPVDGRAPEFGAILALALFAFLCATSGGIGTLIALIYPTIRAYSRLELFLGFLLLLAAGLLLDKLLAAARRGWRLFGAVASFAIVLLATLDQAPVDLGLRDPAVLQRFVADRQFVRKIEATVPAGTEIYQYPYSNYLINSPYYGWGAFAHVRFYLHSQQLRWSNGAFKNSPVDRWHMRLAGLPPEQLLTEVRAAGFGGLLVDRTVVGDAEYERLRSALVLQVGAEPVLENTSRLAFWHLPSPGYRLIYGPDYQQPLEVLVDDPQAIRADDISRTLSGDNLLRALHAAAGAPRPGHPVAITRAEHPEAFADTGQADAGLGLAAVQPLSALQADVACPATSAPLSADDVLTLTVRNRSRFDIRLNSGPLPIRIGLWQLLDSNGAQVRGDSGFRLAGSPYIHAGQSTTLRLPVSSLDLRTGLSAETTEVTAVFALVQESVAWFGPASGVQDCRVRLRLPVSLGRTAAPAD